MAFTEDEGVRRALDLLQTADLRDELGGRYTRRELTAQALFQLLKDFLTQVIDDLEWGRLHQAKGMGPTPEGTHIVNYYLHEKDKDLDAKDKIRFAHTPPSPAGPAYDEEAGRPMTQADYETAFLEFLTTGKRFQFDRPFRSNKGIAILGYVKTGLVLTYLEELAEFERFETKKPEKGGEKP